MTRGEIKQRAARLIGLSLDALNVSDDSAALDDAVDDAVVDILSRTRLNVRRLEVTLDPDEYEFTVDQGILKMWSVAYLNSDVDMEEISFADLARTSQGAFAIEGYNRIGFSAPGGDISMLYTPRPEKMTDDAHDVSSAIYGGIPDEFAPAIVNYVAWQLAPMTGDQSSGAGERYRILYEGKDGLGSPGSNLGRIKEATNRRGGTGARRRRLAARREQLIGDADPRYWS